MENILDRNFLSQNYLYLGEIKRKLFLVAGFFMVIFLGGFFLAKPILRFFLEMFRVQDVQIVITSPFQFFGLSMELAFFLAIVISFPLILFQLLMVYIQEYMV